MSLRAPATSTGLATDDFVAPLRAASAGSAASTCSSTSAARWSAACAPSPSAAARPTSPPTAQRLKAEPAELDAFLDRVTINVSQLWRHEDQWTALATTILPELAERGRIRAWSAGCVLRRRGLHARRRWPRGARRASRVEIHGTDLDAAWSRAPAPASSRPRTRAPRRARALEPLVRASRRTAAGRPSPQLRAMTSLRRRRPAAHAGPGATATTWSSAATPSSTSPRRSATRCTRGSRPRSRPAAT